MRTTPQVVPQAHNTRAFTPNTYKQNIQNSPIIFVDDIAATPKQMKKGTFVAKYFPSKKVYKHTGESAEPSIVNTRENKFKQTCEKTPGTFDLDPKN